MLPKLVDDAAVLSKKTYITVKGKVRAALVSAEELELLEATLEVLSDPVAMQAIREGKEDVIAGRLVSLEEVKTELGL
jgi:PHD/YefM family antitoxin component YafN of YafNO toxin-antitoxin module